MCSAGFKYTSSHDLQILTFHHQQQRLASVGSQTVRGGAGVSPGVGLPDTARYSDRNTFFPHQL